MEITALLVSLVALGFSIYSVIESRRNNRASHRPAIVSNEVTGATEYRFEITNEGAGPAYFKSVEWFWDKQPLGDKSINEAVNEITRQYGLPAKISVTNPGQETVLAAGKTLVLGSLLFQPEHLPILEAIREKGFELRIVYESGFGERFVFSSSDDLK